MPEWLERFLGGVTLLEAIAVFALVVLAVGALVKLWPFISNSVSILNALIKLPTLVNTVEKTDATVTGLVAKVDSIYHETHNNDGSSIKDSVDRIEKFSDEAFDRIERGVKGLYERTDVLADVDAQLRREIEDTQNPLEEKHHD